MTTKNFINTKRDNIKQFKVVSFMLFLIFIVLNSNAQESYFKLIDKSKFKRAEKKISKHLKKDPNDIILNLALSKLLINKNYSNNNPYKSYEYLVKSEQLFSKNKNDKELNKLNKLNINNTFFIKFLDTICLYALTDAIHINTIQSYEKFITFFKKTNSKYLTIAIQKRDIIAYDDAKKTNTISAYKEFMLKYPNASQANTALQNIHLIAFEEAKKKHTVDAFQLFIDNYPNSQQFNLAELKRDSLAYLNAEKSNKIGIFKGFIIKYPKAKQVKLAWAHIYQLAYENAIKLNTINAYKDFLSNYPNASQVNTVELKIQEIEFQSAENINTITAYNEFILKYPNSIYLQSINTKIHNIAFNQAKEINTAKSYSEFMINYPKSEEYHSAKILFEEKTFYETTKVGDWISYKNYIDNNSTNPNTFIAIDSIFKIAKTTFNLEAATYCLNNFSGYDKEKFLMLYHDIYTIDGERQTLNAFYEKFTDNFFDEIKVKDYELATEADNLKLELSYNSANYFAYDEYIRKAAPNDRAFLALQRIISTDLKEKKWSNALNKALNYKSFFGANYYKLNNLISIIKKQWDASIIVQPFNSDINTTTGSEYCATISADDKCIYFCAKNRKDNVGGEDIFVAGFRPRYAAHILNDLSTPISNDAPLSITTDGTSMIIFQNGKLYISNKHINYWSAPTEISSIINSASWQADAMISSDGMALIFSSIRDENYDYFQKSENYYHGENEHPSDIYVSLKDINGEWGSPINLGPTINTIYCDRSPFLHPDMKTLYFSSSGHGGLGSLDVFKTTRLSDTCWTCWSEPINLGKEINSIAADWGYKITTDGDKAYFSTNIKQTSTSITKDHNNDDIYWFNLPFHLRPEFIAKVSGKLTDKNNNPISAQIIWEDLSSKQTIGKAKSDPVDGSYFIVLPLGKIYGYYIDKNEYFPISSNLDLRNSKQSVDLENNINLVTFNEMIENGTAVPVNNLFFDIAKHNLLPYSIPELKRIATIIKKNALKVEISGHTDSVGDDQNNLLLSQQRANSVKDFLIQEGCDSSLLITIGYGREKPIALNNTELGRSKNRRVELRFVN